MQEEAFDVLVFDVFALGEDAEDRQRRKVWDFAELYQYFRDVVLLSQLWLDKVFQCMDPEVYLIASMLLAKVDDILISVPSDVKVQQVFSHAQVFAEHHDTLIKIVHFEQRQQNIVIWLLVRVAQLLKYLIAVFFLL